MITFLFGFLTLGICFTVLGAYLAVVDTYLG